jgi:hypothetical protein
MLLSHISFSLGLIALVAGVCLYLWSVRAEPGAGLGLAKIVGIVVMVLAIIGLICTIWSGFRTKHFEKEITDYRPKINVAPTNDSTQEQNAPVTAPGNSAPASSPASTPNQ